MQRAILAAMLLSIGLISPASSAEKPLNVLFIVADDLRPDLACYGKTEVLSPNIDRLAARGMLLERAYCQVALCNPSRTSFLTGLRPDTTKVYDNGAHFRKTTPEAVSLPQYFKAHGYHTQALGKIFHPGCDDVPSWSAASWDPTMPRYGSAGQAVAAERAAKIRQSGKTVKKQDMLGPPWEAADATDEQLADGDTASQAVQTLGQLKDRPFFLAVGFLVPHLPFVAPKKYWELYPAEKVRLASNPFLPKDVPECALHHWSELRAYVGMPQTGSLDDEQARAAIRGYRAATSFLDAQVGRVLAELDRLGLSETTVVVFLGDHGWQLGEHAHWCKHTNFEVAVRAPLIISAPGMASAGKKSKSFVEFVDIYPTLAELCGLPKPTHLDGLSFVPLIATPERPWKQAAFSQFQRKVPDLGLVMGRSVRNDRYRYTEWTVPEKEFVARELYDHRDDPDENVNIADRPASAQMIQEMARILKGPRNILSGTNGR